MSQLVINHSDEISNIDAVLVVSEFIRDIYSGVCLSNSREAFTRSGVLVLVKKIPHENKDKSPCSSIFDIGILTEE
jgi:hypothetical protein